MRYSEKMKIVEYLGAGIACIFLMLSIVITINLLYGAVIFALVPALGYESSSKHFKNNIASFSSRMNYCYSCGSSLKGATAGVCPQCDSRLDLLDVLDV